MDTKKLESKRNLSIIYTLSFVIAVLMTAASIAGLLYQKILYQTDELRCSFLPNDVVILLIGLPMLLCSMWFTWRGKLIGLLFWPGALFFVLYNYIIYLLALPLNMTFILSLALITLSVYTLIGLLARIDGGLVRRRLYGIVRERLAGGILAGLGLLFFLRALGTIVITLTGKTAIAETELALLTTDLLLAPSWIVCGVLLWQRKEFGYVSGLGLLFQASMLFIGLIIVLLLQPSMTGTAFVLADVVAVFLMGLFCFIPFALFVHGVVTSRKR
jgi:hypothetical protein